MLPFSYRPSVLMVGLLILLSGKINQLFNASSQLRFWKYWIFLECNSKQSFDEGLYSSCACEKKRGEPPLHVTILNLRGETHICTSVCKCTYIHSLQPHTYIHTHTCTHTTVLCTLTPLHRSHFIATPEIKFHWQRRAEEEEGQRKKTARERNRRETEGES